MGGIWSVVLGVVVLVAIVLALARWLSARGVSGRSRPGMTVMAAGPATREPAVPPSYSPKNVGNDASARPWESTYEQAPVLPEGGQAAWGVPEGFDVDGFLRASKTNFIHLQEAWDCADIPRLRAMMTDDMLSQIQGQLAERERQSGPADSKTEVVMVEARLLGMEDLGDGHMANVEFSGLMREDGAGPSPFREIWSIARAKSGPGGWLVAGVQALQ